VSSPTAAPELILDAWPVLEWIKGREPARTAFHSIVEDALAHRVGLLMSRINHGEVVYSIRKTFPRDRVVAALKGFAEIPIRLYSVDDALVDEAVNLKSIYPVSYADAFGIALSVRMQVPLVTGDPEISRISLPDLKLHWIGK
jgi:predicted nucleic acid-binding protein